MNESLIELEIEEIKEKIKKEDDDINNLDTIDEQNIVKTQDQNNIESKYNKSLEEFELHIDKKCSEILEESFNNNVTISLESEPSTSLFQTIFNTKLLASALNTNPVVSSNVVKQTINTRTNIAEKMYEDYKKKFFDEEKSYLIIINDNDEKKPFFGKSVKEQIEKKYRDECIVGELKIINFNNIKSNPKIKFKDNSYELHKLYINMSKTNEYVDFETYNYEYIKSKMDEVEELVVLLGASNIETQIHEFSEDSNGINVGLNIDVIEKVGGEAGIQNKNSCITVRKKIQKYPDNKVVPNQKKILENKNMHYIFKDNDLKKMLIRRIVSNILHDEYIYIYSKSSEFKNILKLDLSKFGIKFSNEKSVMNSFMIKCIIDYYDVLV